MSSARVQKLLEAMPEQIKRLGAYTYSFNAVTVWQGRVAAGPNAGKDVAVFDIDSATWADNNRRVIVMAEPAHDANNTLAMKTQSHAFGHFIDGSVSFKMYCETPESWTGAQAAFLRKVEQHIVGQLGSPLEIFYGTNDVEPRLEGVNGASAGNEAACSFASAGVDIAGLWPAPGGV
jgi:hypothetical protein